MDEVETRALLKAIRRLTRSLDVQSRRIDRACGLTLPQLVVLGCVRDLGEVTSRTISAAADLSPATVVGILDKLEAKALIERYRSTQDRRVVHARLTDQGCRLLGDAPSPLGDAFSARFAALPPHLRTQIIEHVTRLADCADAQPAGGLHLAHGHHECP